VPVLPQFSGWRWRNVGIVLQHYTASQTRRPRLESSPRWITQISHEPNLLKDKNCDPLADWGCVWGEIFGSMWDKISGSWIELHNDPYQYNLRSRDSSVGIATVYGIDELIIWFDSWRGLGISLFDTASRQALWPTQPPIQWVTGALSLGVKRPAPEADYWPSSSTEVKECVEPYLNSPIRLRGVVLS
jgi:hypothetical protein